MRLSSWTSPRRDRREQALLRVYFLEICRSWWYFRKSRIVCCFQKCKLILRTKCRSAYRKYLLTFLNSFANPKMYGAFQFPTIFFKINATLLCMVNCLCPWREKFQADANFNVEFLKEQCQQLRRAWKAYQTVGLGLDMWQLIYKLLFCKLNF
jgi:hypothetical protein